MSDVGLQITGGPFAQTGTTGEDVWWSLMNVHHSELGVVQETRMHHHVDIEHAEAAAREFREFAGALEAQASLARDFRAQLREVTF